MALYAHPGGPRKDQTFYGIGEWIKRYPQVVYATGPSPFGHALTWGDATKKEKRWMDKFGEWKIAMQAGAWQPDWKCVWTVDVAQAGD